MITILTQYLDWQDWLGLIFFILCWVVYARYAEHKRYGKGSLLTVTNEYRSQWMQEMMRRDQRTMDVITIGNLQRSITFFANTSIFIVLGLMTMLSYHDRAAVIVGNIPFAKVSTPFTWELKIFLLIIIFIYAFFKYTWSMRQYNYAQIFVAAAPGHDERVEEHPAIIAKGGYLVANAARHFNNGLRAYYFGLAALGWFIHPYIFMAVTALVVYVTHRREYHSATLRNLAQ